MVSWGGWLRSHSSFHGLVLYYHLHWSPLPWRIVHIWGCAVTVGPTQVPHPVLLGADRNICISVFMVSFAQSWEWVSCPGPGVSVYGVEDSSSCCSGGLFGPPSVIPTPGPEQSYQVESEGEADSWLGLTELGEQGPGEVEEKMPTGLETVNVMPGLMLSSRPLI